MTPSSTPNHVVADVIVGVVGAAALTTIGLFIAAVVIAYVVKETKVPARRMKDGHEVDPAWPNYFRGQFEDDFGKLTSTVGSLYRAAFRRWWAKFPLLVVSWPVLGVAGVLLYFLVIVFWLTLLLVRIFGDALFAAAAGMMLVADKLYARLRRTEASCPVCYAVMDRPAYACPACGLLHRDIRAGQLGSFFRICTCGRRLPTGVLRAAWQLNAVCQQCGARVHRGAAVLTDVRVPVFGEPHAGKTRLIFAGIYDILGLAERAGLAVSFPDQASRERAEFGLQQIAADDRTVKTEWKLVPALTCQIGSGMKGALLHTFDAAGERFRGADGHDDLRYLEDSHTLVFVVDPFAVPGIRALVSSQPQTDLLEEHLLGDPRNPQDAYGELVSRVRDSGTDTKKQRLAVVVSKADVLTKVGVTPPSESDAIKPWLHEAGLHNVVLSARQEFREVRYFCVASVETGHSPVGWTPSAPFLWAMAARGFSRLGVPAAPVAASAAAPVAKASAR